MVVKAERASFLKNHLLNRFVWIQQIYTSWLGIPNLDSEELNE